MSLKNIQELEKVVNSELTSKIKKSTITFKELLIETDVENLFNIIQFLKSNDSCKFKQLIDIAGIDFPERDKRFRLVYLFLSHENNLRIKIVINFEIEKKGRDEQWRAMWEGKCEGTGPVMFANSPMKIEDINE